jgi:hypothetical protein
MVNWTKKIHIRSKKMIAENKGKNVKIDKFDKNEKNEIQVIHTQEDSVKENYGETKTIYTKNQIRERKKDRIEHGHR